MKSAVISTSQDQLFALRREVLKTRESKERFEESPESFLSACLGPNSEQYDRLITVMRDTPKGLRCLTLDYAISMRLKDFEIIMEDDPEPVPHGPIPIPFVGFNVLAAYNAIVIGNVAAYHQVGAGILVVAAAVATKVAKFNGLGDIDVVGERAIPLPECHFHKEYLAGSLHRKLQDNGFGEARERLYIREIIAKGTNCSVEDFAPNTPLKAKDDLAEVTFCISDDGSLLVLNGIDSEVE